MKTHRVRKSSALPKQIPQQLQNPTVPLKEIERTIRRRFKSDYSQSEQHYNVIIVNEIISNERSHIVAEFKDYLILGDMSEFLQEFYQREESRRHLPKIFEYYESCSVIFPNYVVLSESKYIYKNIQKKQKIIDNQQQLEHDEAKNAKSISLSNEDSDKVFDTKIVDSLLNQTNTSMVHQLFGIECCEGEKEKDRLNKDEGGESFHHTINELVNKINIIELNQQYFTDRYKRCCLKKDSVNMRYANCTTTTKDKSSNGPQLPIKRKMIISNYLSSDKDILMKSIKDMKNFKTARPLSNDNCYNSSRLKETRNQISTSSSKQTILNQKAHKSLFPIGQSNGNSSNTKSSIFKMPSKLHNIPYTSRESKINTEIIQLLTSKLLKLKSAHKNPSLSQFRKQQQQIKKNVSLLSTGTSSITQKPSHVVPQPKEKEKDRDKEKVYDNLYDKYENSPKPKKINRNFINNRNRNELAGNNQTNCIKVNGKLEQEFSLSPLRQSELAVKTCTHLPSSCSFAKEKLKKTTKGVIPKKELAVKGIQIKGFADLLKKNNSRNFSSLSDRLSNKHKNSVPKLMI